MRVIFKHIKRVVLVVLMFISANVVGQNMLADYMNEYRSSNLSKMDTENEILNTMSVRKFLKNMEPYYIDSSQVIRRKAYYLSYKKAKRVDSKQQPPLVNKLVIACGDKNSSIVNQNINYLKRFKIDAYSDQSKELIINYLIKPRFEYFSDMYLVAAYLNVGFETIHRLYMNSETSKKFKWTLQLALARLGDLEAINVCMAVVKQMETNDMVVSYLVPDLVYTKQKQAINYCVAIINEMDKNCSSPNAESSSKILCGYRVMELIAPVIYDFPYTTDATGMINTNNYPEALKVIRQWFIDNQEYSINTDEF